MRDSGLTAEHTPYRTYGLRYLTLPYDEGIRPEDRQLITNLVEESGAASVTGWTRPVNVLYCLGGCTRAIDSVEFGAPNNPTDLFVKVPNPSSIESYPQREIDALRFLARTDDSYLHAITPRLVRADEQAGMRIMTPVHGYREREGILFLGDHSLLAQRYGRTIGNLVAALYTQTDRYIDFVGKAGSTPFPASRAEEYFPDYIANATPLENCRSINSSIAYLRRQWRELYPEGAPNAWGLVHNDLRHDNMLHTSPEAVSGVFDFELFGIGSVECSLRFLPIETLGYEALEESVATFNTMTGASASPLKVLWWAKAAIASRAHAHISRKIPDLEAVFRVMPSVQYWFGSEALEEICDAVLRNYQASEEWWPHVWKRVRAIEPKANARKMTQLEQFILSLSYESLAESVDLRRGFNYLDP